MSSRGPAHELIENAGRTQPSCYRRWRHSRPSHQSRSSSSACLSTTIVTCRPPTCLSVQCVASVRSTPRLKDVGVRGLQSLLIFWEKCPGFEARIRASRAAGNTRREQQAARPCTGRAARPAQFPECLGRAHQGFGLLEGCEADVSYEARITFWVQASAEAAAVTDLETDAAQQKTPPATVDGRLPSADSAELARFGAIKEKKHSLEAGISIFNRCLYDKCAAWLCA